MELTVPRQKHPKSNGHLVVVVEDDSAVLSAVSFAFETDGYAVRAYSSGEALLLEPPKGPNVCLIIDEKLPGVSGLDLLARLRATGLTAPAILITTNPPVVTRRRAAAAGVDIVEKPLLGDALPGKVRAAFASMSSKS